MTLGSATSASTLTAGSDASVVPRKRRGAIDLCMQVNKCGFQDSVSALTSTRVPTESLESKPQREQHSERPLVNHPFSARYEKFFKAHAWLDARGLKPETLAVYETGYYENRARRSIYNGSVMLKIRRVSDGECVGHGGRRSLARKVSHVVTLSATCAGDTSLLRHV